MRAEAGNSKGKNFEVYTMDIDSSAPLLQTITVREETMVDIREVGPRDGLQSEKPLHVQDRLDLVNRLIASGLQHIEVASFMRDEVVPSMAGAEELIAAIRRSDDLTLTGLVANLAGVRRALKCDLDEITITISLSDTYSRKNMGKSSEEALVAVEALIDEIDQRALTDVVISCAFGSPYDDVVMEQDLLPCVQRLRDFGCNHITLADTTGVATPRLIRGALELAGTNVGLHLHETRGTGLLNAFVGFEAGVRRFDTSVGGIGGSPFADGAAGNVATEALVNILHDNGFATGIDLSELLHVARLLPKLIGHKIPSFLANLT